MRRNNILLGCSLFVITALVNVGCFSYKMRYGAQPKIDTENTQNKKPVKTYLISSIISECGAIDAKKTQRIKQELSKLNYERYNFTDSSTSSKVTVFSEAKNAIIKKPKIFGRKMLPYWLTLGVLPGSYNSIMNPTISLHINDGTKVDISKGEMIYDGNVSISVWSPLGLINFGGRSNKYHCVNQIKGNSLELFFKGRILKNQFKPMAYHINTIIDNYENQK